MTDDQLAAFVAELLTAEGDLTVSDRNVLRDCEIARGFTSAKPVTVLEAKGRVVRAMLARKAAQS